MSIIPSEDTKDEAGSEIDLEIDKRHTVFSCYCEKKSNKITYHKQERSVCFGSQLRRMKATVLVKVQQSKHSSCDRRSTEELITVPTQSGGRDRGST